MKYILLFFALISSASAANINTVTNTYTYSNNGYTTYSSVTTVTSAPSTSTNLYNGYSNSNTGYSSGSSAYGSVISAPAYTGESNAAINPSHGYPELNGWETTDNATANATDQLPPVVTGNNLSPVSSCPSLDTVNHNDVNFYYPNTTEWMDITLYCQDGDITSKTEFGYYPVVEYLTPDQTGPWTFPDHVP